MSKVIAIYHPLKIWRFAYCVNYSTSSSPWSAPNKWKSATVEEYNKDENEDFQPPKQKHASVSSEAGAAFDEKGNKVLDHTDLGQKMVCWSLNLWHKWIADIYFYLAQNAHQGVQEGNGCESIHNIEVSNKEGWKESIT